MTNRLFVDTSAWIALYIAEDQSHEKAKRLLHQEINKGTQFYTSNYVFDESITRLAYDAHWPTVDRFIVSFEASIKRKFLLKLWVDEQTEEESIEVLRKYHDQQLSFTEATIIVLVKRYRMDAIFSFDNDFRKIGIRTLPE